MKVSPLAPALWLAGMIGVILQLLDVILGTNVLNPIITLLFFLLTQELSKFIAEMTMEEDDGNNST